MKRIQGGAISRDVLDLVGGVDIVDDRRYPKGFECYATVALQDVQAGEEIFDNYATFGGDEFWEDNENEINTICSGGFGLVSEYENQKID